jgi:serine/threonine protein kinase
MLFLNYAGNVFGPNQRYKVLKQVSQTEQGSVFVCLDMGVEECDDLERTIVVKKVKMSVMRTRKYSELMIMMLLNSDKVEHYLEGSDAIVKYLGAFRDPLSSLEVDGGGWYLQLEYHPLGAVIDFMGMLPKDMNGHLRQDMVQTFCWDMCMGLKYMHSMGVCHRDIKLENLLVYYNEQKKRFALKYCDFGFSGIFRRDERSKISCGSPAYAAPELLMDQDVSPFATDIWAFGVTVHTIALGNMLFELDGDMLLTVLKRIQNYRNIIDFREPPEAFDGSYLHLLDATFQYEDKRKTISEISRLSWVNRGRRSPGIDYKDLYEYASKYTLPSLANTSSSSTTSPPLHKLPLPQSSTTTGRHSVKSRGPSILASTKRAKQQTKTRKPIVPLLSLQNSAPSAYCTQKPHTFADGSYGRKEQQQQQQFEEESYEAPLSDPVRSKRYRLFSLFKRKK